MAHHLDGRSNLLVALCAAVCFCCGESSPTGPSGPASGGSVGSSGAAGAAGSTPSGAGANTAGSPSGGAAGANATAGAGGSAGGASGGAAGASGGAAGGASGGAGGAVGGPTLPFVYVGSTNGQISIYKLDAAAGQLSLVKSVGAGNYPSFIAVDPKNAHLYAVNEPDAKVAAFTIDQKTGDLTLLNRVSSGGDGPAFISVDHSGKYVMVANYDGGTSRVFPITADGSFGAASDSKSPGMYSHQILTDPANKFAFVVNLGSNTISQYVFDATNGTLTANSVPSVKAATGAGPRHLAFHPSGKFAYLLAETKYTLSAYSYDATLGQLTSLNNTLSMLPAGADGTGNSGAEVAVAPSGNFVYGSNRGHNSIATFSINATTGLLTFVSSTPSGGSTPRSFTISADGKLMLVANESGNVTSFSVDVATGALAKLKSIDVPKDPQFVGIVNLPAN